MPIEQESLNQKLFSELKTTERRVKPEDVDKKQVIASEAEIFAFNFVRDNVDYGTVRVTLDGVRQLIVYFSEQVANSPKHFRDGSISWEDLLEKLKAWAMGKQLSFKLDDMDNFETDMMTRKQKQQMNEGYHAINKKTSYNDSIPTVKVRIQHTREMNEGEQRFRQIAKIFIENADGERILAPTTKPGIAKVYGRHIAEGGKPNDARWNQITSLCEEYQKMAGFVRATRSGQFNESAQQLVNEGLAHYQSLRETLSKMTGKRGYNAYFESWTPSLMEDEEQVDLSEMFMTSSLDPRIESVIPILGKLSKNITESPKMSEVTELEEWADKLVENDITDTDEPEHEGSEDYVDPEEADYGDEYQDMVKRAGSAVKRIEKKLGQLRQHREETDEGEIGSMVGGAIGSVAGAELGPLGSMAGKAIGSSIGDKITDESIDANQKRVGQFSPDDDYAKRGQLVGESEDPMIAMRRLSGL
jgi:hypothetical protein